MSVQNILQDYYQMELLPIIKSNKSIKTISSKNNISPHDQLKLAMLTSTKFISYLIVIMYNLMILIRMREYNNNSPKKLTNNIYLDTL